MSTTRQPGLFDPRPRAPYAAGSDTSREAAESIAPRLNTLQRTVLAAIGIMPDTCDGLEVRLGLAHQTCSARVRELKQQGRIEDTGQRRKTRSGRNAVVWAVPSHAN